MAKSGLSDNIRYNRANICQALINPEAFNV